jgi:hypothetical protein
MLFSMIVNMKKQIIARIRTKIIFTFLSEGLKFNQSKKRYYPLF